MNKNGKLDAYEDWRLSEEERIHDLVGQMSIHQIAGLMLYSAHQAVSTGDSPFAKMFQGTYNGKPLSESGCEIFELSDQQKKFLYTAVYAGRESIAKDSSDRIVDRSYYGKTNTCSNEADLDIVLETKAAMGEKPVIVSLNCKNPTVLSEFEPCADAILVDFNVQAQAVLELISGGSEPSALLPFQMPADMKTVEEQKEDVAHDMRCYIDSEGNSYDFAFGMNFNGIIGDDRVRKYRKGENK